MTFSSHKLPDHVFGIKNGSEAHMVKSTGESSQNWKMVKGISGVEGYVSFESVEKPGHFLKSNSLFELIVAPLEENNEKFKQSASFLPGAQATVRV